MPKWVVVTKGPHRGRIGIFAGAYEATIKNPRVNWASGQHDDLKGSSSRVAADSVRAATPEEIQTHFDKHPDDQWQLIDADERRELPSARAKINWELEDGRVETWAMDASLRHRGKIELRNPAGDVTGLFDNALEARREVLRYYGEQDS